MALFDHYIPGVEDQNQGIFFGLTKQLHNISQQFEATLRGLDNYDEFGAIFLTLLS